jgi:hemerythrin
MQLLQWKPSFSLGVPAVDFEHRQMIRMINEVYGSLADERDAAGVESVLGEIHARISAHFALEERLMREAGYSEYAAHKDSHEDLLDQIRDLMDSYAKDPQAGRLALERGLSDWFGEHFATFDFRLHKQLRA